MAYSSSASIVINASRERVWNALTKPELVKQYFFGTNLDTSWEPGSPIFFRGEWEGKQYEDKGTVLVFKPMEHFSYDYWSPMSEQEDIPENYQILDFTLAEEESGIKVTIDQSNVDSEEKAEHSAKNWATVLEGLKKLAESGS